MNEQKITQAEQINRMKIHIELLEDKIIELEHKDIGLTEIRQILEKIMVKGLTIRIEK